MNDKNDFIGEIFEKGIECAKPQYILFENILILAQIGLGITILYPLKLASIPWFSIGFLMFALLMLVFVLRKHLCTKCYYYGKSCHCGWGKLALKLYKKDSGNYKLGGKLAAITWASLMLIPFGTAIFLVLNNKVNLNDNWIVYASFLLVVIVNLILHKKDCKECKMRYICPGSAAKSKTTK